MTPKERAGFERLLEWRRRPKEFGSDTSGPSPQQVYAEWMKVTFGPALRVEWMRGSGVGSSSVPGGLGATRVPEVAYSDSREVRFTVDLSVIRRELWAEQRSAKPHLGERPSPTIHYGAWADQVRIGTLTPEEDDKWWRIVRGVDSSTVRDEALHNLLTYGVPWLQARIG